MAATSTAPAPPHIATHPSPSFIAPPTDSIRGLTRSQVAQLICLGHVLVLHRGWIYRLNGWLQKHPGGALAILHFVGRDATDELEAYHPVEILRTMRRFAVARVITDEVSGDGWDYAAEELVSRLCARIEAGDEGAEEDAEKWKREMREVVEKGGWPRGEGDQGGKEARAWKPLVPHVQLANSGWDRLRPSMYLSAPLLQTSLASIATPPSSPSEKHRPGPSPFPPLSASDLEPQAAPAPLLSPAYQRYLALSYRLLHARVIEKEFYSAPRLLAGYGPDVTRFALSLVIAALCYVMGSTRPGQEGIEWRQYFWNIGSALAFGFFWHQVTFVVHDAGHSGITGIWALDRGLAIFIASGLGGLSAGWWCDNHDVHHLVTNDPSHDPDIQHMPFFAVSTKFFAKIPLYSTYYARVLLPDSVSRTMVPLQDKLFYVILSLARFNLFANSYAFLALRARRDIWWALEWVGIALFWTWFTLFLRSLPSSGVATVFVLVSFITTSPLHVQIVLSHFGQSTDDMGMYESFVHRQLRTTMDVDCPRYLDFLHGGLHLQVAHHLFTRVPRHRLRDTTEEVEKWCEEEGVKGVKGSEVEYRKMKFIEGNKQVIGVLAEVGRQVRVLHEVAKAEFGPEAHGHKEAPAKAIE